MPFSMLQGGQDSVQQCAVCEPGIYQSDKGSIVIKLEGSSNGKTAPEINGAYVIVMDVDSNCTFLKEAAKLKGNYTKVGVLEDVVLDI